MMPGCPGDLGPSPHQERSGCTTLGLNSWNPRFVSFAIQYVLCILKYCSQEGCKDFTRAPKGPTKQRVWRTQVQEHKTRVAHKVRPKPPRTRARAEDNNREATPHGRQDGRCALTTPGRTAAPAKEALGSGERHAFPVAWAAFPAFLCRQAISQQGLLNKNKETDNNQ